MKLVHLFSLTFLLISCQTSDNQEKKLTQNEQPNILIIYADDLGYGDVSAYGATELETPNMDFLANEGVRFTNGYASAATCTRSSYALLTG